MSMLSDNQTIILLEDDPKLSKLIKNYLEKHSYSVICLYDGTDAVQNILKHHPQLLILDLMLPGNDGLSICRELRPQYNGGILMLTASDDDMDQVAGLELGADDYVIKPIHPRVLLARIRTLIRNKHSQNSTQQPPSEQTTNREQHFGQLVINSVQRFVELNGERMALTHSEFEILKLIASQPEYVFSRDEILQALRGIEYDGMDRSVDVKISSLRKKLGDSSALPKKIITVRGKGYLFVPDSF